MNSMHPDLIQAPLPDMQAGGKLKIAQSPIRPIRNSGGLSRGGGAAQFFAALI